jgi:hypothetical protein
MPKRISSKPMDVNQAAHLMVERSTAEPASEKPKPIVKPAKPTKSEISRVMAAMGRKGGKIGGKRRMVTMTSEERRLVAIKAVNTRWSKRKKSST